MPARERGQVHGAEAERETEDDVGRGHAQHPPPAAYLYAAGGMTSSGVITSVSIASFSDLPWFPPCDSDAARHWHAIGWPRAIPRRGRQSIVPNYSCAMGAIPTHNPLVSSAIRPDPPATSPPPSHSSTACSICSARQGHSPSSRAQFHSPRASSRFKNSCRPKPAA